MLAEEVFVNCYSFNPISQVKKAIFNVSYKTILSRSRNSDWRLRGAGVEAKRINFGFTTLTKTAIDLGSLWQVRNYLTWYGSDYP